MGSRHFTKEDTRMADKLVKGCSTASAPREKQIKATMGYHDTTIRTAKLKKSVNTNCWWACGKTDRSYTAGENIKRYRILENSLAVSLNMLPSTCTCGHWKWKFTFPQKPVWDCRWQHYFYQPQTGNASDVAQWVNGSINDGTSSTQQEKEWTTDTGNNLDESPENYAEWKKASP